MTQVPKDPNVYHITHVDHLASIVATGGLFSAAETLRRGLDMRTIGMADIKRRRIEELEVTCHPGTKVGEFVPFNFCPRSVMLYVIYARNHPELAYRDGQAPIIHLEADFHRVVRWADRNGVRWAFTLTNAGARCTEFRADPAGLHDLDWDAIRADDFRDPDVKERKQAEFLVYEYFPFELVERIGVREKGIQARAAQALAQSRYAVTVEVQAEWYY